MDAAAASLLPLQMSRAHLHRTSLLPPSLQPTGAGHRSPPPPNPAPTFGGLCTMTAGGRLSPPRPRSSSTSLMAQLAAVDNKPSVGGAGSFLGFHGGAPTAANSADNNTCRLIDYRNAQVAAFHVSLSADRQPLRNRCMSAPQAVVCTITSHH